MLIYSLNVLSAEVSIQVFSLFLCCIVCYAGVLRNLSYILDNSPSVKCTLCKSILHAVLHCSVFSRGRDLRVEVQLSILLFFLHTFSDVYNTIAKL